MAAQSRTTLKGYFNTGDTPTETQFANLIDSSPNTTDDGTVATLDGTETLTNKTIDSASNTITVTESNISDLGTYVPTSTTVNGNALSSNVTLDIDDVTPTTTKGDIIVENGSGAVRLGIGTDTQVLTADSTQATGVKWSTPAGGGDMTAAVYDAATIEEQLVGLTATQTLTNKTLTSPVISSISNTGTLTLPTSTGTVALTSDITGTNSGTNTGDQVAGDFNHDDLANITGTAGQYNHPTDAQMTVLGNTSGTNTGDEASASTTVAGVAELATSAETTTGTDTGRVITPDGLAGSDYGKRIVTLILVDDTTDTAVADGVGDITYTIPSEMNGWNLVGAHASVETAGTTGTTDIQIYNVTQTADMLSTKITIDSGETSSYTAATAPVIDTANDDVATGDKIRIDCDAVATTAAKGLQAILTFQLS